LFCRRQRMGGRESSHNDLLEALNSVMGGSINEINEINENSQYPKRVKSLPRCGRWIFSAISWLTSKALSFDAQEWATPPRTLTSNRLVAALSQH
jgi:hypothetical protein